MGPERGARANWLRHAAMPLPPRDELARVLAARLREADPKGVVWTSDTDALEAANEVDKRYRPDPAGRPLDVGRLTEKIAPETYHHLFVVIRAELEMPVPEGHGHLQFITVGPGERISAVYENTSQKKARAVAEALSELEEDP
jgi:hypothetical protein